MLIRQFGDFKRKLPNCAIRHVLDIGANVGDTVAQTVQHFPNAAVDAFEPVQATFCRLSERFAKQSQIKCHNFAMGALPGQAQITAIGTETGNEIVSSAPDGVPVETIAVLTGDDFVKSAGIDRVSFLKIDTEGFDLKVLQGFAHMLAQQKIDIFQVEVGMGRQNTKHVALQSIQQFAEANNYWLFKLYDQAHELDGRPLLRRADAVFISAACMNANIMPDQRPRVKRHPPLMKKWISALLR